MEQEKINILLVDDQPANLLALSAMLESESLRLVKAESGTKALKALLDQDFAVVLLDVQMPGLDGFETATLIRQREKSRSTPIIFVTALSRSETNVFRGYSLGAVDYLFKPIVPEILRSKVSVFVELFRKNDELKRQARELARLMRQTELILNHAAEGVFGVDLRGYSTFVNPAAARMIGHPPEAVTQQPIHDLLHPGNQNCTHADCQVVRILQGEPINGLVDDVFWRSDGTTFPVEYSGAPMRDEAGELIGAVITFRDVSERKAAALALENERLYKEAQAANQAKDNFLATLSHELRTPMTAILGWVQILRMGDLDDASVAGGLETIESSARAQARLIDDMLDVSRIILGKFRLDLREVSLSSIVEKAADTVRPAAEAKGLTLKAQVDQSVQPIQGDPSRLQQVIWNLLSNAIKFTEAGGEVSVVLQNIGGEALISVKDTGAGIPKEFLPHVFERLRQADGAQGHGGLGLGLAISQFIIEQHGGVIRAESDGEGKGATFTVTIPLSRPVEQIAETQTLAGF